MQNNLGNENPCQLIQTERGFSVSYKNRPLYSKYNPTKAILQTLNDLQILPGTLILCCSPCLWYGMSELLEKLPENCFVFACETDSELWNFSKQILENKIENFPIKIILNDSRLIFLNLQQLQNFPQILNSEIQKYFPQIEKHKIKRVIKIDFSAGVQLYSDFYTELFNDCQNVIAQFWKNRLTLVKFGRLYSANLIQNLARSKKENIVFFEDLEKTVSKPILVLGTGESLEKTVNFLKNIEIRKKIFILAVDATLPVLKAHQINADAVVGVESQLAIEKVYLGNVKKSENPFVFFADTASRPHVTDFVPGKVCYFTSEYDSNNFFEKLKDLKILPKVLPPMGSVGLTSVLIALNLRQSENIPIFISGLDFSFTVGKTHANGSWQHNAQLMNCNRVKPLGNFAAAFANQNIATLGKNSKKIITNPSLLGYAQNFPQWFKNSKNLYDIGQFGIPLGITLISENDFLTFMTNLNLNDEVSNFGQINQNKNSAKNVSNFIENELLALNELKSILSGEKVDLSKAEIDDKILKILESRNYLFLHFPDGFKPSLDLSFLKRIRSELNFFIKIFEIAKRI